MKTIVFLGALLIATFYANANTVSEDYKCYVDYIGGGDGLQFIQAKPNEVTELAGFLKSEQVSVIGRGKKAWINKVYECVKESAPFTIGRAQELDKVTPR